MFTTKIFPKKKQSEANHNGKPALLVHCLNQMPPLNHKRTKSSLAPPISYVAKKWQLKDRRLPIEKFI
jgi:hypothetical protein